MGRLLEGEVPMLSKSLGEVDLGPNFSLGLNGGVAREKLISLVNSESTSLGITTRSTSTRRVLPFQIHMI